ncbi:MAG: ABC transporter substrate-binding protein [Candidatus Fermentithermobacillus carboniphilus]|uniref:ABC transporter substrate-binding protein n=1 Tax=Candidatus Fermentithermobacillus carboniphilus TaxID=3085328 RepID=A0AAT9LDJ9_9FIRM|nr:MAG: ABC transporter substrate-binding protein [Candidatus Fermentithermobacillus carboniphilus]
MLYTQTRVQKTGCNADVTSDYSSGLAENFEKRFKEMGGNIVAKAAFRSGDLDFRPQLSEIVQKKPDILILPNLYKENALIAKQAHEMAALKGIPIMAGDSYSRVMFEMAGKEALENYYTVQHFHWDDPALKAIKDKYFQQYGEKDPELNVVMGYDMMYFIADCIKRAGKLDGKSEEAESREKRHRHAKDPEDVKPKESDQWNFTDPDSRIMVNSDKAFVQGYNAQAAESLQWEGSSSVLQWTIRQPLFLLTHWCIVPATPCICQGKGPRQLLQTLH